VISCVALNHWDLLGRFFLLRNLMTHWLIFLLSFLRLIDQSDYWGRRKLFCKKDNNQFDKRSFGREAG